MKERSYGFTLIELMVVIAIIGVFATIGIRSYNQQVAKAIFTEVVMVWYGPTQPGY